MKNLENYIEQLTKINVSEYTSVSPTTVNLATTFNEIYFLMKNQNIRHLPVLKGSQVVGLISQRDLLSSIHLSEREVLTAESIMSENPYTVFENTPLDQVCFEMSEKKLGSAIVIDNNTKLLGLFTTTDALNALVETLRGDIE